MVTPEALVAIVQLIPEAWLGDVALFANPDAHRNAYRDWLLRRMEHPRPWVEEALRARALLV